MEASVIGAALLFIGTGCGPALSKEQRDYLRTVKPDGWYPVSKLKEVISAAADKDVKILVGAGKLWAQVMAEMISQKSEGETSPAEAIGIVANLYTEHHKDGDIGEVKFTSTGEFTGLVEDTSLYPCDMINGVWKGLPLSFGAYESEVKHAPEDCRKNGAQCCRSEVIWKVKG